MTIRVAINGFGRIGRAIFRIAQDMNNLEIVAINDLTDPATLAHLLKYDSVHGPMSDSVRAVEGAIIVGEKSVPVSAERSPSALPWKELQVDVVLECTGVFRTKEAASAHLDAGAKRVIISAPGKGVDATVVLGVNDHLLDPSTQTVISNASCTTNCLAPVAKVLQEKLGIRAGQMTTVHAYTADQRLLDAPHKDLRRARSAALSMIPTTTGAAAAVGIVLPALQGKLTGMAVRVPTPNVSMVDFVFTAERDTTIEEVNQILRDASLGSMKGILEVTDAPLVSVDLRGASASSVVDSQLTSVQGGNLVKVISWYDNEWGFSHRMVDLCVRFGG